MDTTEFTAALVREGYGEVSTRVREPLVELGDHSHPYDVRALMLAGELTLTFEGKTQVCRGGDIFTMKADCLHSEKFGPEGATFLVGRRTPA